MRFSLPTIVGLFLCCNSIACFKPSDTPTRKTDSSIQDHQRLGFRFERLYDGILITEVTTELGAERAGLKVGDIVWSVDAQTGDRAVECLQDLTRAQVQLKVQPRWTSLRKMMIVERGVGVINTMPHVSPWLVLSAKGDLHRAKEYLRLSKKEEDERLSNTVLEADFIQGLRLVARNYPSQYTTWLKLIASEAPKSTRLLQALMEGYASKQDFENVLMVYDNWLNTIGWDLVVPAKSWSESLRINLHSNLTMERLRLKALWALNRKAEAIEHMHQLQNWYSLSDLESIVGMAPMDDVATIWSNKVPIAQDIQGVDVLGQDWSIQDKNWTILAFWATWCAPCKRELPELDVWLTQQRNVEVLAVNLDEKIQPSGITKALRKLDVSNLRGVQDNRLYTLFEIEAVPTLVLLDRHGVEQYRMIGYSPLTISELTNHVNAEVVAQVPIGQARRVKVTWYPNASIQDVLVADSGLYVLQEDEVLDVQDWSNWIANEHEAKVVLSELKDAERLLMYGDDVVTLHKSNRIVQRHTTNNSGVHDDANGSMPQILSFGEQILGWEQSTVGLWFWSDKTIGLLDTKGSEYRWDLDSVQDLQVFLSDVESSSWREVPLSVMHSQKFTLGVWLQTSSLQSLSLPFSNGQHASDFLKLGDVLQYADTIKSTHILGVDVLAVENQDGVKWIHRKHQDNHSIVVLNEKNDPIGTVDLFAETRIIQNLNTSTVNNDVWLVIPQRGLMHLEVPLSNVIEQE